MATRLIWKYELEITDKQELTVPRGAKFLSAGNQDGKLCVWASVDPKVAKHGDNETVTLSVIGTGNPFIPEDAGTYLDTVIMPPFVWHVFVKGGL